MSNKDFYDLLDKKIKKDEEQEKSLGEASFMFVFIIWTILFIWAT